VSDTQNMLLVRFSSFHYHPFRKLRTSDLLLRPCLSKHQKLWSWGQILLMTDYFCYVTYCLPVPKMWMFTGNPNRSKPALHPGQLACCTLVKTIEVQQSLQLFTDTKCLDRTIVVNKYPPHKTSTTPWRHCMLRPC